MSVLAFKALDYGVDRIPDKFWHSIPGGYYRPPGAEKGKKQKQRNKSEQRNGDRGRRRSARARSPPTEYSDYSGYEDTDYEREQRRRDRHRRAKSLGRSPNRDLSGGRDQERSRELTLHGEMDRAERAERGPQFSPPPTSEYRPYDPRDYAPPSAPPTGASMANGQHDPYDRRASSAGPDYGYQPQGQRYSKQVTPTGAQSTSPKR
ncbi:hypothetical protein CC80DRAFT_278664 [Byssothecium circinans]|uniref:Uncharacterized protein n=1 Tax=Byssothecium circinans TaxID=147558 RepID=A0A6A5T9G3_9PLEO|nr:hypothetical protein CC80DRAFT_278664 [Byssothecium circinans]